MKNIKLKSLFSLVLIGFSMSMNAQLSVPKVVRNANLQYRNENYCTASSLCVKAYKKIERRGSLAKEMKGEMAYKTGECFRQTENVKDANNWYEKAIVLKYYEKVPEVYFLNAEMLRSMGEFKKAKENYILYKELVPTSSKVDMGIRSCDIAQEFNINETRHLITNIEVLNKDVFEMAPMFSDKNQTQLIFSSTRLGGVSSLSDPRTCNYYMDLWISELDKNENWEEPKLLPIKGINTVDNEGTVCFDGSGKKMFFTRCPNQRKNNLGCDIWTSELIGKDWDEPVKLILKVSDSMSVGHPCVSEDGMLLIFSSDIPGGFGGKDLWYTTNNKETNQWSKPINMGPEINTSGNELFPTFALNGDLFFASDGMPGIGRLDIYRASKGADLNWGNPKNLGFPINSVSNDYALIEQTDQKGFFTSERSGSVGQNHKPDLWKYEMPPNEFDLRVNVYDLTDKNKKIEGAKVVVTSNENISFEGLTGSDGSIFWDKKPNNDRFINEKNNYIITISKDKYKGVKQIDFTTKGIDGSQNFVFDLPMLKDAPIRLPEVRYPLAQWSLLIDATINSKDSLNYVYELMMEYPNMVLELSSHTDARDTEKSNLVLSENRAKECVKYLVEEKGIDPRRLVPVGKGENSPRTVWLSNGNYLVDEPEDKKGVKTIILTESYINTFKNKNNTLFDFLHQLNRRTEGKVLDFYFENLPNNNNFSSNLNIENQNSNNLKANNINEKANSSPNNKKNNSRSNVFISNEILESKNMSKTKIKSNNKSTSSDGIFLNSLESKKGLFFTVQVGVFSSSKFPYVLNEFENLYSISLNDGIIRYSTGIFNSVNDALPEKLKAHNKGIYDAFITAYYNGMRISIAEAEKLLEENSSGILEKTINYMTKN